MHPVTVVAIGIALINLPFGYWREGVRKFSLPWFVAVHGPIPLAVVLRLSLGVGWHLSTFPVLVGVYFSGQFVGGAVRKCVKKSNAGDNGL